MSLAVRVIPTLLHRGAALLKGRRFASWRTVGVLEQAVRVHQRRGVDELCIIDIAATKERRGPDLEAVARITDGLFCPVTVGGGVRDTDDVRALLEAGADKVLVTTALLNEPRKVLRAAMRVGCQAIVAGLNYGRAGVDLEVPPILVADWASHCVDYGAGEILLTSTEREGTMQGYDLQAIEAVANRVDVPVIAHGGAGTYAHMHEAILAGASAVAAGAMFQFTNQTPRAAAKYLAEHGVEARV